MGNDLAKIKAGSRGVQLATVADMRETAGILCQSGLLPEGYKTAAQVFVGLQFGAELGLRPMTALNSIAVIRGKPTLWGDAALGMVKTSGLLTKYYEKVTGVGDAMIATVKSEREGNFVIETTFSVDDAITAGLWGKTGPWKTHPKRMLKYKARAFNLRDNFPDILKGLHLQEEMVGEADVAMEAPKCDVPDRHNRRKKVESNSTPPPKDPAEAVTDDNVSAGVREQDITPDKSAEDNSPVASADVIEAEVIDEAVLLTNEFAPFDDLLAKYATAGGTDFTEWAAEALCRDEDEVDSIEKFDADMIDRLARHLESGGV
jgi:hypothetical protein